MAHWKVDGDKDRDDNHDEAIPYKKKFQHSLDSDEEDTEADIQKYNFLDLNEIDGQEDGLARVEGDIKITAFNMREELENGYFDKEGTFIFKKKEGIEDHWVQNIDSMQIADISKIKKFQEKKNENENEDEENTKVNIEESYKKMLTLMNKNETVKSAIQRLGVGIKDLRIKNKKAKSEHILTQIREETSKLDQLTSISDQICLEGDINIYQKTYEQMSFVINKKKETS